MLAGLLYNDTLPQVVARAFSKQSLSDEKVDSKQGNDDFRLYNRHKIWRVVCLMNDNSWKRRVCFLSWTLEPLEHLLQVLQRLSDSPNPLLNMLTGASPVAATLATYLEMVEQPLDVGHYKTLFTLFDALAVEDPVRHGTPCIAAQLWWRWLP